jgi:hypothetical protein
MSRNIPSQAALNLCHLARRKCNEDDGSARGVAHQFQLMRMGLGEEGKNPKATTSNLREQVYNVELES